jgi:hypothetical protein
VQAPQTPDVQICPPWQGTEAEHETHCPSALHASPDEHAMVLLHGWHIPLEQTWFSGQSLEDAQPQSPE